MKEPNVYSFFDECYVYYGDYAKEVTLYDELICNRNNEIERLNNIIDKAKTILENIDFFTTPTGEVIHLDEKIKDINKAIRILRK